MNYQPGIALGNEAKDSTSIQHHLQSLGILGHLVRQEQMPISSARQQLPPLLMMTPRIFSRPSMAAGGTNASFPVQLGGNNVMKSMATQNNFHLNNLHHQVRRNTTDTSHHEMNNNVFGTSAAKDGEALPQEIQVPKSIVQTKLDMLEENCKIALTLRESIRSHQLHMTSLKSWGYSGSTLEDCSSTIEVLWNALQWVETHSDQIMASMEQEAQRQERFQTVMIRTDPDKISDNSFKGNEN